ncbi:fibrinogen-like YCDxxxxGGGW domain-containing protein, partial [Pseudactinotalea sp.]|uniref:fibrinogen-like YCDxxxxGGGW domain-containing protein n=1 Tax=Pseudactinotalea sp. TaxID=1926260 RepID=UPI003B3AE702
MNTSTFIGRARNVRFAIIALAVALVATVATAVPSARADVPLPDGLSDVTAAASCWEIKQNTPAAPSGVYWLVTPELVFPQQFYCDQSTDGGGWVLIARGRDGWTTNYEGNRTPGELRNTPTGTGAFRPAQLPSATVDGLLDGRRVDSLGDGVRIRRAADVNGNTWQEVRFKFSSRDRWVWALGAEHRVGAYSFSAVGSGSTRTGSGGQTSNFGADNGYYRLNTSEAQNQGWTIGLSYGPNITGTTSATSYVWSNSSGVGNARPFAQMYLRPQLRLADLEFPSVPAEGTPATEQAPVAESAALRTVWGVSGFGNGQGGELNTEVAAFAEVDGTVYVGGNFRYVQRDSAGTGQVQQPFLAAFDVDTGEWVSTFRPQLNGQVKALFGLPDGRLAVGGQFSSVGGSTQTGMAFLNASTGALQGTQVQAENRSTGGTPYVRGFDLQGAHLYVSGNFTHLVSLSSGTAASAWNGGRIALSNTAPDTNWNAFLNGTSVGIDAASQGDRVYFSGYFKMKQSTYTPSAAAIQTSAGASLVAPVWKPTFSKATWNADGTVSGNVWQFGVAEADGRVYLGGSEHSIFGYDRVNFGLLSGSITKAGGDFQVIYAGGSADPNVIYGGCHCGHWSYEGAYTWDNVGTNWTQGDAISLFGAWDASTGQYIQTFAPQLSARAGYGVWGIFQDSAGTLWVGGDLSRSVRSGGVAQWSGGFVRYGIADTAAPSAPSNLTVTPGPDSVALQWSASTDDRGGVVYEILQEGRVITSTALTTATVPASTEGTTYAVRARDTALNRSASTPPVEVVGAADIVAMVADGSTWSYRWSNDAWPSGWFEPGFDASSWSTGAGLFGVNAPGQVANLNAGNVSPRPLSAQFLQEFDVADPSSLESVTISVVADDGVVVWVNGVEIGRTRMPSGTLTQNSYATATASTASAVANRSVFEVPASVLVDGENVVAA